MVRLLFVGLLLLGYCCCWAVVVGLCWELIVHNCFPGVAVSQEVRGPEHWGLLGQEQGSSSGRR